VKQLPKDVFRVTSRDKTYLYYQRGRGTKAAGERVRLPNDPDSPEFMEAYADACSPRLPGVAGPPDPTMANRFDQFMDWLKAGGRLEPETVRKYARSLAIAARGIGHMEADTVRPHDIRLLLDQFVKVPGAGNNVLAALRAVSSWGLERGHFDRSFTQSVKPYKSDRGHKPWTPAQCAAAERHLVGNCRRAYFFARYTGQRGSDVVLLTPLKLDEGGFWIVQKKTKREVWCPLDDRLAAEMATWPKQLGSYLQQHWGKVYSRKLLTKQFFDQRAKIPELAGCTFHGLRATRVVELRQGGLTTLQIADQVGMSVPMIEKYCRFADKKAGGKASVIALRKEPKSRTE
jgi:integrase